MSTELTNAQVLNSLNALQRFVQGSERLPIRLSVVAHDNLKTLQNQAQELDSYRQDLLEEVAEFDEDGNVETQVDEDGESTGEIKFKDEEARQDYLDRLNDNYQEEVELDLKTISFDVVDRVEAEPQVVFVLDWMFTE